MTPTPDAGQLTYLALGDSYTIGESVEPSERWPVQMVAALREQGIPMGDPTIIARTGWTTGDLLDATSRLYKGEQYDLVSLMIGVNNQYQELSLEQYRREFKQLLELAVSAAGGKADHVVVLSIPDWGFTPFAETINRANISEEIDAFNAVAREESETAGARYVDITPSTRPNIFDAELFAEDGLHPSAKMYTRWVELVSPVVLAIFDEY